MPPPHRDIVTVDAPVDRHLEVAEIHRRVIAAAPWLSSRNVTESSFRLVTNLFGTARRAELALWRAASG
jgi:UbiD family decarboxylase